MKKIAALLLGITIAAGAFAANMIVGDYGGSMSVSPSGAAMYTIPIECPKGVNGIEPTIALVYNSQSGIGLAGKGWSLSATSVITKVNAVPFYDNKLLPLNYDKSADYLALDGQRLIKTNTISSTEVEFRTECDNFNRIIRKGSGGSFYFEVYTTSGLKMTYRQQPEGASYYDGNLGWYLTRVEDPNGNYMTYEYQILYGTTYGNRWSIISVVPTVIRYGANSQQGTSHTQKVEFTYSYCAQSFRYPLGGNMKENSRYLTSISTYAGTTTLNNRYELSYKSGPNSEIVLEKVKKYGNNGDYLKDLNVNWNSFCDYTWQTEEKQTAVSQLGNNGIPAERKIWYPLDYNDDGYTDLVAVYEAEPTTIGGTVYMNPATIFDYYKNDKGTIKFEKSNIISPSILSYEGTMKRISVNGCHGAFLCHLTSRTKSTPIVIVADKNKGLSIRDANDPSDGFRIELVTNKMPAHTVADINNDGYDDILIANENVRNGKSSVLICYGGQASSLSGYAILTTPTVIYDINGTPDRIVANDMDGDGLVDIVVVSTTGFNVLRNKGYATTSTLNECTFQGQGFKQDMNCNSPYFFVQGDFNGDGIVDFCKGEKNKLLFYSGNPDFTFSLPRQNLLWELASLHTKKALTADFNGDGLTDLLLLNGSNDLSNDDGGDIIYGTRSSSDADKKLAHVTTKNVTDSNLGLFMVGDFYGHGKAQILSIGQSMKSKTVNSSYIFINKNYSTPYIGLLSSISSPTRTYSVSYSNLLDQNVYTKRTSFADATNLMTLRFPMCVVKSYTEKKDNWTEGWSINSYRYEDLVGQTTGKGLLGFLRTEVEHESSATDIVTTSCNSIHQAKAILYPSYTETKTYWGDLISRENYTYNTVSFGTNARAYQLQLTKKESLDLLNNTSCVTTYSSYSKGQPTVISVDYGDNVKSKVELKDLVSNNTYNIFLPQTKVETKSNGSGSVSYTSKYTYDGKFRLIKSIELYGTDKAVTTTNSYTMKGNLSTQQVSASGCENRTTSYDYTGSGRFVSKKVTPDGVTTTYSWNDALGRLTKETTSVGSLSYVTTYNTYDGFNNCLKKTLPDGRISTTAISLANPLPPIYYKVKSTLTGSPDKTDLFDADGNLIRTTTTYADGSVRSDFKSYDGDGRLTHHYFPVWGEGTPSGGYYILLNTYDDFGRIKTEVHPTGTTTYTYAPLKTTITSPLGTKVQDYNKAGQLIKSTENGQSVTFTYTPAGQIATSTALSSSGNLTTTMTYDIAGNRISITDPDVGTIQNEYDAYGRDTYTLTETGREILSRYDSRGRLQSVKDGIDNAAYTYNDNNQLVKEQCNSYSCTYTYDGYNRVTNKLEKLAGVEYQTQYAYPNNYGGVSKITYPSGLVVNNTYNDNGYLTSVSCAGKTVWSGLKMNEYGEVTQETLAGNVVRNYTYNGKRQLTKESAYKGTTGLMDLTYTYTGVNITKKADALGGNAEQYTYDNLNRLTGVTATKSGASLAGTHTYDALGNMTKTWDNYWRNIKYGENSLPPHKVSSVSYTSSAISGRPAVTFDSYRMPTHIEQGDYAYDIEYRPDHRRCRTKSYKSGKVTCRKYYLTNYEKEVYASGVNREIHYLYGGNGLAGIYVRTDGKDTLFAAVTDRQNSLTAVMDVATGKVEKFSYKPWGMRRNPANWSENVVTDYPARFSRGYCMHEHLPQFGLINMGGRVFHERTNQFLSADPYRQAPESWLNCNRFGYCMNNPVMYSDPDGEILIPILIAAAISAGVNVGIKAYNGQLHSAGDVAKALGWGALAGGVGGFIGVTAAPILAGGGFFAGFVTGTVCAFESTLIQSLGNHLSFGDPMISNAALAFNSLIGGLTCGIGNGIMAKIGGRNFWSGRPQQYCGPDMDMLPQKVVTEKQLANESKPNFAADEGGDYSVYRGVDRTTGEVKYIGITERDPQVRWAEHLNSNTPRADLRFELVPDVPRGISRLNGRIWEQTLINQYGGPRNVLYNQINSIAPKYWNQYNIPPVSPGVPPASLHFIIKSW